MTRRHSLHHRPGRRFLAGAALSLTLLGAAACGGDGSGGAGSASGTASRATTGAPPPSAPGRAAPSSPATTGGTSRPASATVSTSCAQRLAERLTPAQRAGQLLMVGVQPTASPQALAAQVSRDHLGGVIYLGGWQGAGTVESVSRRLQAAARSSSAATGGLALLVAADQEGGQVQQLRGPGFTRIPSARTQATMGAAGLERSARAWARELAAVGVNINLAPVADTVPASLGGANAPIGAHRRDFAPGDARANGRYAAAFVRGTLAAGVAPTVKHFPGLGRVTGNTDLTSSGTTDRTTTRTDPYLHPFAAGIAAGAPVVMVSSARYPRLDPENPAMFSEAVVTGLLRGRLGFDGVVITDDVGAARAVADVPVQARATRFIAAGGDVVLTADAAQAPAMLAAIAALVEQSPAFAARVEAATGRVLALKVRLGLARCP